LICFKFLALLQDLRTRNPIHIYPIILSTHRNIGAHDLWRAAQIAKTAAVKFKDAVVPDDALDIAGKREGPHFLSKAVHHRHAVI
jgi:3-hydroxymyristoyl/3-hydroxydecanoyl-(acyl carrier protein) dehydratase